MSYGNTIGRIPDLHLLHTDLPRGKMQLKAPYIDDHILLGHPKAKVDELVGAGHHLPLEVHLDSGLITLSFANRLLQVHDYEKIPEAGELFAAPVPSIEYHLAADQRDWQVIAGEEIITTEHWDALQRLGKLVGILGMNQVKRGNFTTPS